MQISHVISDLVLAFCCIYVFFKYLAKLNLNNTVLWESFVLSVAGASIMGAIGFMGYDKAKPISIFFQHLASINGAVGLVAATYALLKDISLSKITCYIILTLGFLLFAISEGFNIYAVYKWTPIVSMVLVLILGLMGIIQGKTKMGIWIIIGVVFFALASFRKLFIQDESLSIDVFHILTAAGILSLGMAVGLGIKTEKINTTI